MLLQKQTIFINRPSILLVGYFLFLPLYALAHNPDDTASALELLQEHRLKLANKASQQLSVAEGLQSLDVGLWTVCEQYFSKHQPKDYQLVLAKLNLLRHNYQDAASLLQKVHPTATHLVREKRLIKVQLFIQAWDLDKARQQCMQLLAINPKDIDAGFWLGRIAILKKSYQEAEKWAVRLQKWDSTHVLGYGLEAEVQLWNREIDLAEVLLKQALTRNPFHPDFRFWYGYVIWRKRDAKLLDQMAAQWELALSINPYHYLTHWHWGNGHTNLTYADYIHESDQKASKALKVAEALVRDGNVKKGLRQALRTQQKYHHSTLPLLFRASTYYNLSDAQSEALDSAQIIFDELLTLRPHYGPAHNGLAAVIKKKQFRFLANFKDLEASITQTEIPEEWDTLFHEVFPDLKAYPTDRVSKMVWSQLFTGKAYLPMLKKLNRKFVIPSLHTDLAAAMNNPWFRSASTFDNRQWMDIRGVGSGATGIEYVERGAHLERNVTLHEYVHLFHHTVLTEAENRKIRQLFFKAKAENRTLDYYAANNESEYFAQCFTAYFSTQKVHPLNHKSMNTRQDLKQKDPEMFEFLNQMTAKQQAFLAGDESALAENWAQTYVILAQQQHELSPSARHGLSIEQLYQKALSYQPDYLPAQLGLIQTWVENNKRQQAQQQLDQLLKAHPHYAPAYLSQIELTQWAKRDSPNTEPAAHLQKVIDLYQKAYSLETDPQLKAGIYQKLNQLYLDHCLIDSVIQFSAYYHQHAAKVSTYLYDAAQQALGVKSWQAGMLGYPSATQTMNELLIQYPQNYQFWLWKAAMLAATDQHEQLIDFLSPEAKRLSKTGNPLVNAFNIQLAEAYLYLHKTAKAKQVVALIQSPLTYLSPTQRLQLARVYAYLEEEKKAQEIITTFQAKTDEQRAALAFTQGKIAQHNNELDDAISYWTTALKVNPYHVEARKSLIRLLKMLKQVEKARLVAEQAKTVSYPFHASQLAQFDALAK
ncbi:MAG: tetratricopeptide repeat protein [Flammeovirgaceae bacterium]